MDDEGAIDDLEASDDELSDADLKVRYCSIYLSAAQIYTLSLQRKLKLSQFHIVKRA